MQDSAGMFVSVYNLTSASAFKPHRMQVRTSTDVRAAVDYALEMAGGLCLSSSAAWERGIPIESLYRRSGAYNYRSAFSEGMGWMHHPAGAASWGERTGWCRTVPMTMTPAQRGGRGRGATGAPFLHTQLASLVLSRSRSMWAGFSGGTQAALFCRPLFFAALLHSPSFPLLSPFPSFQPSEWRPTDTPWHDGSFVTYPVRSMYTRLGWLVIL
jgi:hypothetical protein